jgi:hypothetical protein
MNKKDLVFKLQFIFKLTTFAPPFETGQQEALQFASHPTKITLKTTS